MSDDEFELDFVSKATKTVQNNWKKSFDRKSETKLVKSGSKPKLISDDSAPPSENLGKDNKNLPVEVIEIAADDKAVDVSITPPPSPTGTPTSTVRGAKITKKTQKALDKLKTANIVKNMAETRRKNSCNENGMDDVFICLSDDENIAYDGDIELKVRWKTDIIRVKVSKKDKMGKVMDSLATKVGVSIGDINMYLSENSEEHISRDSTIAGLGLSIVSVLYGRERVVVEGAKDEGTMQVKLQTKDRRVQPVLVDLRPTDKMETVMAKFCVQSGLERKKLKFFFDGEQLNGDITAEDLELEGGECLDVHVMQ